ncbi:FKBP-type peptidyl-prolyl cis-trans isomerase [Plantibacter cousiniae (nom. nud.)]|uniref:Peptidyl-prolyl cis-trans isomerase n=1 Tax=Plantibacter cousiniae (nom. nud.) TaxID=199709 RepID=A0ABY1LMX5_9MICO|nr:FKBP-type peptidyl-prolyl cis-trans isomerase [Plantibacter cousiniae]SKC60090.1 peptidylprolyl isomerase [Plantibacter cousiniae]
MRTAPALIAAAGLLLVSLTGCTAPGSASCDTAASAGDATKLISVSGDFGATPKVELPKPLYTKTTERQVVIQGDGQQVSADGTVNLNLMLLNGRTGDVLQQTDFNGPASTLIALSGSLPGFAKAFACTTVGSRVVAAISPEDAFGPSGGSEANGIKKDDAIILVADIQGAALPKADGAERPIPSGFPSVVTAPSGQPGITIPAAPAPTETKHTLSRVGDGATVKAGDQVIVNYTGVLWDQKSVFDSSWEKGQPLVFQADGGQMIKAFNDAVVGQQVGSQIVLVVAPKDGYGEQGSGSVPAGATLVFVIDVLGTQRAAQ